MTNNNFTPVLNKRGENLQRKINGKIKVFPWFLVLFKPILMQIYPCVCQN